MGFSELVVSGKSADAIRAPFTCLFASQRGVVAPIETHYNSPIRSGFRIPIE